MQVNIQKFLQTCGLDEPLYPGKRVVKKLPQPGEYKSHCVVYDWRDPNKIRIEIKAGLSGKDLLPSPRLLSNWKSAATRKKSRNKPKRRKKPKGVENEPVNRFQNQCRRQSRNRCLCISHTDGQKGRPGTYRASTRTCCKRRQSNAGQLDDRDSESNARRRPGSQRR